MAVLVIKHFQLSEWIKNKNQDFVNRNPGYESIDPSLHLINCFVSFSYTDLSRIE